MRIIFRDPDEGGAVVLIPAPKFLASLPEEWTEEQKLIHVANKDIPTGVAYEIVEDNVPPSDRTFREAWEYEAGPNEKVSADLSQEEAGWYAYKGKEPS